MREWITGRNPVYETLRAGRRVLYRLKIAEGVQEKRRLSEILKLASSQDLHVERVRRDALDKIAYGNQGVALEAGDYPYSGLPDMLMLAETQGESPFILILDTLQDPQNLGTLLRTAEAVGVHGVLLPLKRTATVTPAVVNASSGASEHLLIAQINLAQAISRLQEAGVWVVGLDGSQETQEITKIRLDGAIALVVGSEGEGMRQLVRDSCDVLARLPMRGKISALNAAAAGSVALYLALQARQKGKT
jgi:23S rRNA (guanosine2251-2'-O)-methyltransferase